MRHLTNVLASAAVIAGSLATTAAQAETRLKVSHYLPSVHGIHTDFIVPWTEQITACTDGEVTFEIFAAGSQLGNVTRQQEQVLAGVVDVAHGLTGLPRGRFPRTSIIDVPFLSNDAGAATYALWSLHDGPLAEDYKGMHLLALHAHNGGLIHTKGKSVKTMADLKGLRIRTPSPAVSDMLTYLGADPQGLPPGEVYENIQRGVLDGTVFPWDPVKSFGLNEVVDHHLDLGAYTVSFFFAMNQRSYDKLSDKARACVDQASGDNLVGKFGDWWDAWDKPAHDEAVAAGHEITVLTEEQRNEWRAALQPVVDNYLAGLEAEGIDNARDIYDQMVAKVAEYEQQHK
ncbi:TRAP transporter substrate-binding protein [Paracoccus sp. (in: a-proteobacteria)]|uniref:TRAP transporter substrate-binding protein n=1 Tax=Paracoccus sp. TaxID=267 RepID=UPI003A886E4B